MPRSWRRGMWGRARRRAPPRCGIQGWGERRGPRGPEPANNGGAGGGGEGAPPQRPAVPASWPLHARARPARLALPFLFATVPAALQSRRLPPHAPPRPDGGSRCLSASTRDIRFPILSRLLSHFLPPPPPLSSHTLSCLLEWAVLLGRSTSSLTPLSPFWRPLWTSLSPYLICFLLASLLG